MAKKTILLVEDNKADHFLFERLIKKQNDCIEVKHASDGKEALKLLEKGLSPDLIVLDIVMPGLDGFEFLELYAANDNFFKTSVVMLTSSYEERDRNSAFGFDCVKDYICKPMKPDDFERIKSALENNGKKSISITW